MLSIVGFLHNFSEADIFHATSILVMASQYNCWKFLYQPFSLNMVLRFFS